MTEKKDRFHNFSCNAGHHFTTHYTHTGVCHSVSTEAQEILEHINA